MGDISNLDVSWRTLLLFGCCFPILLIILQLLRRETERRACRALAAFVFLFALGITPQIIGFSGFYQVWPGLTFAPFNTDLWLAPLLLLHLRRLCLNGHTFANGKQDLWLLAPGILQTCYYSLCFVLLGDGLFNDNFLQTYKTKWAFNDAIHQPYIVPVETLLVLGITLYCLWQSFALMQRYQHFLNQTQSQANDFIPVWFKGLLYGLIALVSIWLTLEVLSLLKPDFSYTNQYPFYYIMSLIVLWSALQALSDIKSPYPKIYPVNDERLEHKPQNSVAVTNDQTETESHSQNQWKQKYDKLIAAMEKQQWYLKPDLCLKDLAALMGTNQSYLSKTINEGSQQNFNQFVNQFRIQHASQALQHHSDADLLTIAWDSGFNSKASFNRIFKASTQMTPSQYRKSHQKNN